MSKTKKNKQQSSHKVFTSFYEFNKWLHSKDWISHNPLGYQSNFPQKAMVYNVDIAVTHQR